MDIYNLPTDKPLTLEELQEAVRTLEYSTEHYKDGLLYWRCPVCRSLAGRRHSNWCALGILAKKVKADIRARKHSKQEVR